MIPVANSSFLDGLFYREDDLFRDAVPSSDNAQSTDVPDDSDAPRINDADDAEDKPVEPPDYYPNVSPDLSITASGAAATPTADEGTDERTSPIDGDSLGASDHGASDGTYGGRDPGAIMRLYNLERDIDYKVERYRREGKDPLDLFDPSKPDYLGTPQALAPYLGGDLWLASNSGGNPPSRGLVFSTRDVSAGEITVTDRPIDAAQEVTDREISEPVAAEDARAKAAERLARSMRAGGDANSNLLPLTLLLALPFAPEIAPTILEADGVGPTLSAGVVGALRTVWPKIKDVVTQLPQFVRLGHNPLGLSFDDFLKEIQTHQNDPSEAGSEPAPQSGDGGQPPTAYDEIQKLRHTEARDLLGLLDPDNPVLKDGDGSTGTPTGEDVERIHKEIEKQKGKAETTIGTPIEIHHNAPRGQRESFERAGLDIEKYTTYLKRNDHRLRPGGLHTGQDHWNRQWRDFFSKNRNAKADKIHEQLLKMMKGLPRWKR
jgi:hypothetical protein